MVRIDNSLIINELRGRAAQRCKSLIINSLAMGRKKPTPKSGLVALGGAAEIAMFNRSCNSFRHILHTWLAYIFSHILVCLKMRIFSNSFHWVSAGAVCYNFEFHCSLFPSALRNFFFANVASNDCCFHLKKVDVRLKPIQLRLGQSIRQEV